MQYWDKVSFIRQPTTKCFCLGSWFRLWRVKWLLCRVSLSLSRQVILLSLRWSPSLKKDQVLVNLAAHQLFSGTLRCCDGWGGASSVAVPVSGSFPPCQPMSTVAQNILCSLGNGSSAEGQALWNRHFPPFFFFFHSLLTPCFPWDSSKNNPRAILSHQRHKELLLLTNWLFRTQRI